MFKTYSSICLVFTLLSFSQSNTMFPWMKGSNESLKKELKYSEVVNSSNSYWKDKDKNAKGSGYKIFKRWEYAWHNKTNDNGNLITPQEIWTAWQQKNASKSLNSKNSLALPKSDWKPIGPFQNASVESALSRGRVNIVHVDPNNPNIVYFGTPSGGIWKSTDAGATWIPKSDYLPQIGVSGIAVDYSNSNTIYVATGDKDGGNTYSVGVLKSTDGGTTWNTTGLSFNNTSTFAGDIIIHPTNNKILWCATNIGLYRTIDAGVTWDIVQTGNFARGTIRLKPGTPSTLYAVSNNKFFRSTNSGATFTNVSTNLPADSVRLVLDVTAANPNYVYILSAKTDYTFQGIYRSSDSGVNWTQRSDSSVNILEHLQAGYDLALAVSTTNAEEIFTGCLNVWKSADGGKTHKKINDNAIYNATYTHADIHYLGYHGNKLYCGSDGGICLSDDNGTSFKDKTGLAQITQFYKLSVSKQSANKIAAGAQDNGGFSYSNNSWRDYHGGDGMDNAISPLNSNTIYGFEQFGRILYNSNDGGKTTTITITAPPAEKGSLDYGGNWVTPLAINSKGELFSGYSKLYKLVNNNWSAQSATTVGEDDIENIKIAPSNDDIIFVINEKELYKSTNRGIDFKLVYTDIRFIKSIEVHSTNSDIVYLTTNGNTGRVLKSVNGGVSFSDITNGIPDIGKNIIVHQGRNSLNPIYVGTIIGVYYKDDSMTSFQPFDTNLPNVDVYDLEINLNDGKLLAATYGRGVWQTDIPIDSAANDVKFESINNPIAGISCNRTLNPQITVKNNGLNTISSVTLNYSFDNFPSSYVWNGTIAPGASQNITLPSKTFSSGVHTLSVSTTIASDKYADNNSGSSYFYVNEPDTPGIVNTFTNPGDALLSYNDNSTDSQWVRGTRNNGNGLDSPTNTVYTTNLTGNYPENVRSYLISRCYNLSNVTNPSISFSMKYDLEKTFDGVYVEYSTDFGSNWNVLGTKTTNWYNVDKASSCYFCPGDHWTGTNTTNLTYSYPLNSLNKPINIIFRIVFISDQTSTALGVNIDNFVINGTLSNQDFELENITIFPNPSKGIYTINLGNIEPSLIEVYDLTGKIIKSNQKISITNSSTTVDLTAASDGIYFVKIVNGKNNTVKRIIKN